ncbi:uncharacterized protein [Malus domestica]|uniref:uncharacterized protein isoform X1 n=2 Tax=Malus domestica TaxID=3750 RepID=UPI003976DD63
MVTNSSSRSRSTLSTTYPTLRFIRSQYRRRFHTLFVDDDDLTQILSRFEENSSSSFEFTMRMLTLLINCSFCSIGVHCLCQLKFLDYNGSEFLMHWIWSVQGEPFSLYAEEEPLIVAHLCCRDLIQIGGFGGVAGVHVIFIRKKNHFSGYIETCKKLFSTNILGFNFSTNM